MNTKELEALHDLMEFVNDLSMSIEGHLQVGSFATERQKIRRLVRDLYAEVTD